MKRFLFALIAVIVVSGLARADYAGLGPALPYNDYVLGNFTQAGTDAGSSGPNNGMGVAVGGNFAPAGGGTFTVNGPIVVNGSYTNNGGQMGGSIYGYNNVTFSNETVNGTVYAGNNLTISGGGEPSGGEQYVGTANIPNYFTHAMKVSSVPHPVDFTAGNAYLQSESSYLDSLSSTTGVNRAANVLTLTGSGSNYYDFQVKGSDFSAINTLTVNVSGVGGHTPTVVIDVLNGNVSGLTFPSLTPTYNGTTNQYVLYNFAGSSSIDTNHDGIQGAVLAPNSIVNFNGGNIDGTLIAGTLNGTGESHAYAFLGNPNLPSLTRAVPEPGSIALLTIGGLGVGWMLRRKRA